MLVLGQRKKEGNKMTTYTQSQILTVDGIDFDAILWFDDSDNTVDIEASGMVQSQYLAYPGSSLVEVEANVYTVPISEMDWQFEQVARKAMAKA